ncbi:hypothetical protein [Marinicrinis sediminis]|uniref:Uncharacterized protein n=1 Tax=Marinicrinis sediminis TaxID=1652465 RepID=A0ABW5RE19_9BACL
MTTSRGHQGAHGTGQIEKQLENQTEAAVQIKGKNKTDEDILAAVNQDPHTELDEIVDP